MEHQGEEEETSADGETKQRPRRRKNSGDEGRSQRKVGKEVMERGKWEECKKGGSKGGKGGHGCEVQKPTVMVPVQRERGKEGRRERKEKGGEIGGVLGLRIGL